MNISPSSFVSPNEILSDVLKFVDDERYEINSKGFYVSHIQQALEELSFDTFFDMRDEAYVFPNETLRMEMPKGAFNMRQIYLFNGTKCTVKNSQVVWWKRNFITYGEGYFARHKNNNTNDPFYPKSSLRQGGTAITNSSKIRMFINKEDNYFYNIQNGMIMFSPKCRNFANVLLVYNGMGVDIGEEPFIPQYFRQAVVDYVTEVALRVALTKDRTKYSVLWQIAEKRLNGVRRPPYDGSWYKAQSRVKNMDTKARQDLKEYLSKQPW